jgi:hypothetical protein
LASAVLGAGFGGTGGWNGWRVVEGAALATGVGAVVASADDAVLGGGTAFAVGAAAAAEEVAVGPGSGAGGGAPAHDAHRARKVARFISGAYAIPVHG